MNPHHLDLYTDYLLSSFGQVSATGLSKVLDGAVSHDQVTRMLATPAKTSADIWRLVKPLVREHESDEGVLIVDDSIAEKPSTDENELVSWHWDSSANRAVKGINFVSVLYRTDEVEVPVAVELVTKTEQYTDTKTGKEKRRSAVTKNVRMRRMLHICVHNQIRFKYVLADCWYSSADNMKFIKLDLKKEFILAVKPNRKVGLSATVKPKAYQAITDLDWSDSNLQVVWLEEVPFPVLLARQVFTNEDGSRGIRYLVSSDVTLTDDQFLKLFQKRWSVEVYHKSLKQNAALEKSPTRTETTQRNHFFASLCAYVKLEKMRISKKDGHFTVKAKIYLAAVKAALTELGKLRTELATA